ncbi:MAG: DUF58 domain-containing protein [Terriglobia bacterium]
MTKLSPLAPPTISAKAQSKKTGSGACGPRFFVALAVGLVWIGPAYWDRRFIFAMFLWDTLILLAWLADWKRLPPPPEIEVTRIWLEPLYMCVETPVELTVSHTSSRPLNVTAMDDLPPTLRGEAPRAEIRVTGRGQAKYCVLPRRRGDIEAGPVFLRYRSRAQLAERWAVAGLQQVVRVYPDIRESRHHALYLIRSRQIEMEKRLKRIPGAGRDFESLREYQAGDEPRDICWTATARRGKLITKVAQPERSQAVMIVLDAGRLMLARAASAPCAFSKLDCAIQAALNLSYVALYSGDAVGLLVYGRKVQARLPAGRGSRHLRIILEQLCQVRGELLEADHAHAAELLLKNLNRRSLILWLTDLAETAGTPDVIDGAARLWPRHLVVFTAISQPELDCLVARKPDSIAEMYRYVAAQQVIERRELLLRQIRNRGVLAMQLAPAQLASGLINRYLEVKERSLL